MPCGQPKPGPLSPPDARSERSISVWPVPGGWRLDPGVFGEALMFLSGGCAERQARLLAERLARLGFNARVEIHDRHDALAGSFRYPAASPSSEDAEGLR